MKRRKTTTASIVLALLIGGYSLLRPTINQATGWNLPAIAQTDSATGNERSSIEKETSADKVETASLQNPPQARSNDPSKAPEVKATDHASTSTQRQLGSNKQAPASGASQAQPESNLRYGLLRSVGSDRYLSPAGLLYTPGSAEGHRLEHLRRHVEDQPNRPGSHGVFDGGMEKALAVIDQAYERAKKGQRATKQTDDGRTIYTVDMGKRIGYVGGRDGKRKRNPMARRIRLVLEGTRVITAYPM